MFLCMQYYIDPVSGYVFRSIRDVDRYLETGYIGKNAFKPKDKGSGDMVSKDDKFCVRVATIFY